MALWDMYQHMQIRGMRVSQASIDRDSLQRDQRQEERIDAVDDRIDNLVLMLQALWEVAQERLGVTEADLQATLDAIVAQRTARATAEPVRCASCGATVPRDMNRCQFCGTETGQVVPAGPFA